MKTGITGNKGRAMARGKGLAAARSSRRGRRGRCGDRIGAITGFPTISAQNIKDVTLRQFGTGSRVSTRSR